MKPLPAQALILSLLLHLSIGGVLLFGIPSASPRPDLVEVQAGIPGQPKRSLPSGTTVRASQKGPVSGQNQPNSANMEGNESYLQEVREKILAQQQYPRLAQRQHLEGKVELRIEVSENGQVTNIELISADISPILTAAAREAVLRASPLPAPPPGFARKFDVPIEFRLEL